MQSHAMTIAESIYLDNLFEDIHWIVLIAGHVLCMDSDGETPLIPSEIMRHSIQQSKSFTTLDATLKFMAGAQHIDTNNLNIDQCDQAVRMFSDVLKLCFLEMSVAEVKLGHFMSPEVGCTLMWFLKRWCLSYLLPNENYYEEVKLQIISFSV